MPKRKKLSQSPKTAQPDSAGPGPSKLALVIAEAISKDETVLSEVKNLINDASLDKSRDGVHEEPRKKKVQRKSEIVSAELDTPVNAELDTEFMPNTNSDDNEDVQAPEQQAVNPPDFGNRKMAVSGRKFGGFKDSVGSTEDFDICCDPCKHSLGRSDEAKGFCVDCQENLCKRCVDSHKGLKLCRHHRILDQPQKVPSKTTSATDDSKICTKNCDIHKKEVIKFFCQEHDKVGCSDCMTLDHRTCRIDYIPDICTGTVNSQEFSGTLQTVSATIKEADSVVKISQGKKDENKTNTESLLKQIEKYQKKINDRIEELKQQLVKEANLHRTKRDQDVDKVADRCACVSSELKQVHSVLQDCHAKKLDAQAFISMKRAQSILNATDIQSYKDELIIDLTNILYEPDDQLEDILSKPNAFGRISMKGRDDIEPKLQIGKTTKPGVKLGKETKFDLLSITQMNNIEVKTKSDKRDCYITSCAVISADRLPLADRGNNKLTVVNIDTHLVVEEMVLGAALWDITVLPQDQAAVTLASEQKILFLRTAEKLFRIRNLQVGRRCWGIVYHEDHLYVVCQCPDSLLVPDMRGNIQRDIELNAALDQTFIDPVYIAVGDQTLYISDWESNLVASLTLQGEVTGVYKHDRLRDPCGMGVLEDGSLLVCCPTSRTIHHVSANLKQERTLTTSVPNARCVYHHAGNSQIYVCSQSYNHIRVFRIQ